MKNASFLIVAAVLAVGGVAGVAESQTCSETRPRSDVNGSGTVTSSDALLVLQEAVELPVTIECPSICTPDPSFPRFVDNGDGTVTDRQTRLMWEKKSNDGSIHDRDNQYKWSASGEAPDGTAFTVFLAEMNAGGGFAGHADWRLPNFGELDEIFPHAVSDPETFGPSWEGLHWSFSTGQSTPSRAWGVYFLSGYTYGTYVKTDDNAVRAVRSGS